MAYWLQYKFILKELYYFNQVAYTDSNIICFIKWYINKNVNCTHDGIGKVGKATL